MLLRKFTFTSFQPHRFLSYWVQNQDLRITYLPQHQFGTKEWDEIIKTVSQHSHIPVVSFISTMASMSNFTNLSLDQLKSLAAVHPSLQQIKDLKPPSLAYELYQLLLSFPNWNYLPLWNSFPSNEQQFSIDSSFSSNISIIDCNARFVINNSLEILLEHLFKTKRQFSTLICREGFKDVKFLQLLNKYQVQFEKLDIMLEFTELEVLHPNLYQQFLELFSHQKQTRNLRLFEVSQLEVVRTLSKSSVSMQDVHILYRLVNEHFVKELSCTFPNIQTVRIRGTGMEQALSSYGSFPWLRLQYFETQIMKNKEECYETSMIKNILEHTNNTLQNLVLDFQGYLDHVQQDDQKRLQWVSLIIEQMKSKPFHPSFICVLKELYIYPAEIDEILNAHSVTNVQIDMEGDVGVRGSQITISYSTLE